MGKDSDNIFYGQENEEKNIFPRSKKILQAPKKATDWHGLRI